MTEEKSGKTSSTSNIIGNEPINASSSTASSTTTKIVSFLGSKNNFNPIKANSKSAAAVPLTRLQKLVLNIGKMWNDSFGRRVIAFSVLFVGSAYFVAIPKFNAYIENSNKEDDEDDEEEEE